MKPLSKNILSVICVVLFAGLALASRVNKLQMNAFDYHKRVENDGDIQNFVVLKDGSKVYGGNVKWKPGFVSKGHIVIDDQSYKVSEVKGFCNKQVYYANYNNNFIHRIVHGKVNVYVEFVIVTTTTSGPNGMRSTSSHTEARHYAQRGEDGPFVRLADQKSILEQVAGCPLSEEMINKSNRQIRRSIKAQRDYLNTIFEIYNNGCKPVKDPYTAIEEEQ